MQNIIEEVKKRLIANIKTRNKKILITHMRNEVGNIEATRKGIANIFAKFFQDLYSSNNDEGKDEDNEARLENTSYHADDDKKILKTMNKTDTSQNSP